MCRAVCACVLCVCQIEYVVGGRGLFGRYYGDAGPRMRRLVTLEQSEEAERLAHNLHGVAGSFGARRLQEASKTLELALLAGVGELADLSVFWPAASSGKETGARRGWVVVASPGSVANALAKVAQLRPAGTLGAD